MVSKCVYLDAPMTKPSTAPSTESYFNFNLPSPSAGSTASAQTNAPITENTRPSTDSTSKPSGSAYFGPTAFSAIFSENRISLGADHTQLSIDAEPYTPANENLQSQTFLMLAGTDADRERPRVSMGALIVRKLPDQATFMFLLEWYFEKAHECAFNKPSVLACANSIWQTYGKELKEPRQHEDMVAISLALCKSAESTVREDIEDYESWIGSFSGLNLRWESLGSVFGALTSAVLCLPERDAFFCSQKGPRSNRKNFAMEMKDCVQACITLSNYMDFLNVQMVALLSKNLILQTVLSGDTSLIVWRQLGDLVSATTALGLHRELGSDRPITFVSEWRRRIFAVVFNIDKGSSFLTGRPPALSSQYCKFKMPLDIDDNVWIKGGEEVQKALEKLDADGWNTEGKIFPATHTRVRTKLSIVLNEILALSLGDFENCTNDRLKYLIDRLDQTYSSFPSFIRWNSDLLHSDIDDEEFFTRLVLRLSPLEYKLLLERLAYKQGLSNGQSMVDCAREMLELIVLIWVQRDRFVEHHSDYDWMLMCWGIPSAGVLSVELLKQMRTPGKNNIKLPRSEIIQNLSLLIGFLEWVRPAAGNYKLCGQMSHIIKHILDQILSPPAQQPALSQEIISNESIQLQNDEARTTMENFDTTILEAANFGDGLDNLEWLNDIDWSRGPWIDLGGQDNSVARWG